MTTNTKTPTTRNQPRLLLVENGDSPTSAWKLDEETRQTGLRGLEKARAVLRSTRPISLDNAA